MTNGKTKMAKRHRSFAPARSEKDLPEPLTFDLLGGKYNFECKPVLQGAVILDFVAASEDGGAGGAAHMTDLIVEALKDDDEVARFNEVIRSKKVEDTVSIEELGEIVAWLVEEYTSRPTQAS